MGDRQAVGVCSEVLSGVLHPGDHLVLGQSGINESRRHRAIDGHAAVWSAQVPAVSQEQIQRP